MIICSECGEHVSSAQTVYRKVQGFEKLRGGGGANQIVMRSVLPDVRGNEEYLCSPCLQLRKVRQHFPQGQESLL